MAGKLAKLTALSQQRPQMSKEKVVENNVMVLNTLLNTSGESEYEYINLDMLNYHPANALYTQYDTQSAIEALAGDLQRNGQIHNIVVSKRDNGEYYILSGERRTRAFHYLFDKTKEARWMQLYAQVRTGLEEIDEELVLDAANLQARGSAGGELRVRKAMVRFVENIKKKFHVSDEAATEILKQVTSLSDATITRNITIENDLCPELTYLYDTAAFPKPVALAYAGLPIEDQHRVYDAIMQTNEEMEEINKKLVNAIKAQGELEKRIANHEEGLRTAEAQQGSIETEIAELQKALDAANTPQEKAEAAKMISKCEAKRKMRQKEIAAYSIAIRQAKTQLDAENLTNALANGLSADKPATTEMYKKASQRLSRAEKAIDALTTDDMQGFLNKMTKKDREKLLERIAVLMTRLDALQGRGE